MRAPRHPALRMAMALVAFAPALTAGGCASSAPYASLDEIDVAPRRVALRATNGNWQDVRVYLVSEAGGRPLRVGVVPGLTSTVIYIRRPIEGRTRFLLSPIGTRATYTTNAVMAIPGRPLLLTVHANLSMSSLAAR